MIVTVLTFFANLFIIGSIVYMYQVIFGPIDHPFLMKAMDLFHVRINLENISYAVAGISVLLVAALAQIPWFHRITMWLYGGASTNRARGRDSTDDSEGYTKPYGHRYVAIRLVYQK